MKTRITMLLTGALLAFGASATEPSPAPAPAATAPGGAPAASAPAAPASSAAASAADARQAQELSPHDRTCLKSTGSRIPPKDGECVPASGQVISSDDIQRTGATTVGDALRRLSPTVH